MQARGRHALFHAIVTMGAASVQGGCGGVTTDTTARGANAAGGAGSQDAALGSAATGTSVASGGAIFNPTYGQGGSVSAPPFTTAIRETGPPPRIYDAGSAAACAHTEQFQCDVWDPVPQGCRCDENGPISDADCLPCGSLACHSYAPLVGCYCVICIH
jgi:hypothetical protein